MISKTSQTISIGLAAVLSLLVSSPVLAIKKCQDADGKWHYGDVAVTQCNNAKVTTLTERGFIESELDAPKTAEELEAEQAALAAEEAERERLKAIQDERNRILSIYETEDDIDRQRDNQINSVQSNIDVHKAYLKSLDKRIDRTQTALAETKGKSVREKLTKDLESTKARKEDYTKNLTGLETQKEEIMKRFENEKKVYLEIKNSTN